MPRTQVGKVTAIYEDRGYHCIDVELDNGSTVTSSQSIKKGGKWLSMHKKIEEGQTVAVSEREYEGDTFWNVDFKETNKLSGNAGSNGSAQGHAGSSEGTQAGLSLKEWTQVSGQILSGVYASLRASLGEDAEINQDAAAKYATSVLIAVSNNPATLALIHNQKPYKPVNEATAKLHEVADLEVQDELLF